jgi:uncharacterized protein (DUF3820 family)
VLFAVEPAGAPDESPEKRGRPFRIFGCENVPMSEPLLRLLQTEMPYGKYKGTLIADLPGNYLNWMAREGFPSGELGRLLALMHEIDHNGLKHLLQPLRSRRGSGS